MKPEEGIHPRFAFAPRDDRSSNHVEFFLKRPTFSKKKLGTRLVPPRRHAAGGSDEDDRDGVHKGGAGGAASEAKAGLDGARVAFALDPCRVLCEVAHDLDRSERGRKRVIQRRFNVGGIEALPERKASTPWVRPEG